MQANCIKVKHKFLSIFLFVLPLLSFASEGMWIPMLVEQQIFPAMQESGCKLTAEQIYSAKNACLTNAVVRIGHGCTGSFVSNDGLILTNYHCVQWQISQACSNGSNYLQEGFFAKSKDEEIPTARLSIEMMDAMYEVTDEVIKLQTSDLSLNQISELITKDSSDKFQYSIEEFYSGNQYFLFKTKKYSDVRLVAFMPAEIAQFGNNADNWKWPRNSADFALLRVYDETSTPVSPKMSLKINAKGAKEGDFTMAIGFPAETKLYGSEKELDLIHHLNEIQIAMRKIRLNPMEAYMNKSEAKYEECYAQYASLSNYYEKWQGENISMTKSGAYDYRHERDKKIDSLSSGDFLDMYNIYAQAYYSTYSQLVVNLEGLWRLRTFLPSSIVVSSPDLSFLRGEKFLSTVKKYNPELEENVLADMLLLSCILANEVDTTCMIPYAKQLFGEGNDVSWQFYDSVFEKSCFTNYERAVEFQNMINSKRKYKKDDAAVRAYLEVNDLVYCLTKEIFDLLNTQLFPKYNVAKHNFDSVSKIMNGYMYEFHDGKLYPDANNTMRVTFGKIQSYSFDSTIYKYCTTEKEVFEKIQSNPREYKSTEKFLELLKNKDFGSYQKDSLVMNFVATNHTSGGNSGSPVLDAYGNIIGLNFDRNWEGTVSDYYYDESFCRNISVDIRYVLFCLEQYGKADNIIRELTFVE